MNLNDILSNPVRVRILQHLQIHKESTTKQISEDLKDVPAPTIYRHINLMLKDGLLTVKEERKVRGTTERLLAINEDLFAERTLSNLTDTAYQFLMSLYEMFRDYGTREDRDPLADKLCLRTWMPRLNDQRMDRFFSEFAELLSRYQEPDEDGKLRSISIISAPVYREMEE